MQRLAPVIERRRLGRKHPVEDFMFDYYRLRPSDLLTWTPGAGHILDDAADEFADRRFHVVDADGSARVDAEAVLAKRLKTAEFTRSLLRRLDGRPAHFGCFGMHEWAMVYRLPAEQVRHSQVPLRFSPERTAEIVDEVGLRCSHYDAFRFFTDEAAPRNSEQLTRDDQLDRDQGGCLHVTMDLYKWAGKLHPLVSSELLWDCFELAAGVRELDMRASAYDLSEWGRSPVAVETPAGRAEYVRQQRAFADRGRGLRARLLAAIDAVAVVKA